MWEQQKDWLTLVQLISIKQPFGPGVLGGEWKCRQLCKLLFITLHQTNLQYKKIIMRLLCLLLSASVVILKGKETDDV